ncbi:hypothetical protein EI94DRAFT_1665088 [Lactarius quietus]|nr:hypothetical protein EI94DRAFT_1665088 [Lactarius quietus]
MSQTSTAAASSSGSRFQAIFEVAVKDYQKQTKKGLLDHPLASQLQSCNSTTAIISILQNQVREFDKIHSGDERLTKWLGPTVNVINAFSTTVSGGVSLVESKQATIEVKETKSLVQQTATSIDKIKWNQLKQLLRAWLSPADPSTSHNIAQKAQHKGTTAWLFQGRIVIEWKSTGALLWIHGKPGSGKSVICSSIIQDIMAACQTGSAIMAYFYFDFRDLNKQTCPDLLRSLIFQLSTHSSPCCDILHRIYETHKDGTQQPSDDTLQGCLEEMLRLLEHGPVFIVLDAIDECPDSGFPSSRSEVLKLVKKLVNLHLCGLYICATSRPEVDIRAVLEPLASRSVSLHDESGQKEDIVDYVRNVVNSSPSTAMRRWRAEDKNLVIETLTERADGMFRWVFCQLETLQYCFPPNLRQFLNELPESLDETYDRILKGINKAQKNNAHRLLQCLTVASRPLRVEELAELLAFDFQAPTSGGIPTLREDWRWDDEEEAVLSICSSLIAIVPNGDSRVVQFTHFSVKEYLTSPRLAQSLHRDVSRFHIDLESAHTIMAQACLATLLQLDDNAKDGGAEVSPLMEYAAQHWVDHAQFDKVSSRIQDGMDDLFDSSKPHFSAWRGVHDMDEHWPYFIPPPVAGVGSPLYYAAFCGLYGLAERLIMKHPDQVNAPGGSVISRFQRLCPKDALMLQIYSTDMARSWMFKTFMRILHYMRPRHLDRSMSCGGCSVTVPIRMPVATTSGHLCTMQHAICVLTLYSSYSHTTPTSTRRKSTARLRCM